MTAKRPSDESPKTTRKRRNLEIVFRKSQYEVGIIEQVTLKNFMCHSHMKVTFDDRNLNFLVGENGSGKSALLTAVTVGLGGKAAATRRGKTVKGFVKSGSSFGEIAIKLKNVGTDAYQHDLYGDSITVRRRLNTDGGGYYRLESSKGVVISSKKDELDHILTQFNIQVENPVAVLNQDTSRDFLHAKTPYDKYKFFKKATLLDKLDDDYSAIDEQKRIATSILEEKKKYLPDMEKEVGVYKRKWRMHQSVEHLHEKLKKLKDEASWAQVAELEEVLREKEKVAKQLQARTDKLKLRMTKSQSMVEEEERKSKVADEKLKSVSEKLDRFNTERVASRKKLEGEQKKLRASTTEYKTIFSEMRSLESDRDNLTVKIDELRGTSDKDVQLERQQRLDNIRCKEDERAKVEKERREVEGRLDELRNNDSRCRDQIHELSQEIRSGQQQIEQKKKISNKMEASRHDQLRRFGNSAPEIEAKIKEACALRRFQRKPLGPIGAFIKLKDPRFALPVEMCIGGLLQAYCCDNHKDEVELSKLMASVNGRGKRPPIITSSFTDKVYNVQENAVHSNHPSVLNLLIIDEPVIANCLIDQKRIEGVLIFDDVDVARTTMRNCKPQNCTEAYALNGDHLYPSPNYRYYSAQYDKPRMLQANMDDSISAIKEEIFQHEQQVTKTHEAKNQLESKRGNDVRRMKKMELDIAKLRQEISHLNMEIADLRNSEEHEPVDVTTLEEEVTQLTARLTELEVRKAVSVEKMNKFKTDVNKIDSEFKDIDHQIANIMKNKINPLEEAFMVATKKMDEVKNECEYFETQWKEQKKYLEEAEKKYNAFKAHVEECTAVAQKICENRILSKRTAKAIDSEIDQITKRVTLQEQRQGNKEVVTRQYYEAKKAYMQIKCDMEVLEDFIGKIHIALVNRKSFYEHIRSDLALRVKMWFITILDSQSFTGRMNFDHERELLTISVVPGKQSGVKKQQQLAALSGGERSLTTLVFVLTLWETIESPFRMLDEFDVFMDMVTRRLCLDLVIDFAKTHPMTQFILLTPLKMASFQTVNHIKTIKMPDPPRLGTSSAAAGDGWSTAGIEEGQR